MIFLPVVGRELRVAARKRSTFWVRIVAALVALLIGGGFLILAEAGSFAMPTSALGKGLFGVLTWLSLAAVLSAGLFFTSDCLSEEKREGTLGFLFLTDLRGYDVVLGKLLATSLRAFFALFGVFPILGITLLMGGVTGTQFWMTSLALVNALFLSLVAGLFVSTLSRHPQKAMGGTLLLLVLLAACGPALDATRMAGGFRPLLSLSSPVFVFISSTWGNLFWKGLLVNQLLAWSLLALSCLLLPRSWQEKGRASAAPGSRMHWWKFGSLNHRVRLRAKWLSVNPVLWLARRERWQSASLWLVGLLMAGALAGMLASDAQMLWFAWSYGSSLLSLLLYLVLASQSGRLFVEARRSGLIELMLMTPLTVKEIIQGQWRALLRMAGWPLALCLAGQLAGTILAQQNSYKQMTAAMTRAPAGGSTTNSGVTVTTTTTTWAGTTTVAGAGKIPAERWIPHLTALLGALSMTANLLALAWFGMWMGLNSKTTHLATLKTIVFVQIIPWFVLTFVGTLTVSLLLFPRLITGTTNTPSVMLLWYPLVSAAAATILCLIKDIVFVVWSRRKLHAEFRDRTTRVVLPVSQAPPILPRPSGAMPPTIPAA